MNTKSLIYYSSERKDIIDLVPIYCRRVLDCGCGAEVLGESLKKRSDECYVVGIERNSDAAIEAKARLDKVLVGDIEQIILPFERGYFDCIVYGDILEHLVDPWLTLKKHADFLLAERGVVIISIPNVRHYSVIVDLVIRGRWRYHDYGILDKTHLRFFTLQDTIEMVKLAGLEIVQISKNVAKPSKIRTRILTSFIGHIMPEFLVVQWLLFAQRSKLCRKTK